jgi:hypothetical protein
MIALLLWKRFPSERFHAQWMAAWVAWVAASAFAVLAGLNLPVQRAWLMISVVLVAVLLKRQLHPLLLLSWALLLVLIWDITSVMQAGFWLSFLATGALIWLLTFFFMDSGFITRATRADLPRTVPAIALDASRFGVGAVLWVVPASFDLTIKRLETVCHFAYLFHAWEGKHGQLVQVKIGDCAGQPRWEALAMMLAFRTWDKVIAVSSGSPVAIGDALGLRRRSFLFEGPAH